MFGFFVAGLGCLGWPLFPVECDMERSETPTTSTVGVEGDWGRKGGREKERAKYSSRRFLKESLARSWTRLVFVSAGNLRKGGGGHGHNRSSVQSRG